MRHLALLVASLSLAACTTPSEPAPDTGVSDAPLTVGAALSIKTPACPEKTGILYQPPLPEPGFVPAPPAGASVVRPQRLQGATPSYPTASARCHEQGTVVITYCVSADGKVENVLIVTSSGYARLDNAMLAWAARDRHTAGTVNGKPARYCGLREEESFAAQTPAASSPAL